MGGGVKAGGGGTRSRATMTWKAVDTGLDKWLDEMQENMYKPWEQDSSEAREYVNTLDREMVLSTWGSLYCGGQGPLAINLKKTCREFGIDLAMESFKW